MHLNTVCEPPDTTSFSIAMSHNDHFVTSLDQTLRQLVDVTLHTSHVRVEEIWHHTAIYIDGFILMGTK